jgi:mRNA interferase MazF
MKEGDVALTPLPQADGLIKNRPVILLREIPGFGNFLVCGISVHKRIKKLRISMSASV